MSNAKHTINLTSQLVGGDLLAVERLGANIHTGEEARAESLNHLLERGLVGVELCVGNIPHTGVHLETATNLLERRGDILKRVTVAGREDLDSVVLLLARVADVPGVADDGELSHVVGNLLAGAIGLRMP